jgi:hypothetical protein
MRFYQGWSLLGVAGLGAFVAGCAAQRDDSLRLSEELGRARADAAWQRAHAADLESRLSRLEQRAATGLTTRHAEERELSSRLDRLIEMNERLLEQRSAANLPASGAATLPASSAANGIPARHALPPAALSIASSGAPPLSDEQQLRALVVRLRGRPGGPNGGLTREQEGALRVLTRPERKLDAENPWLGFY